MKEASRWIIMLSFLVAAAGFMIGFWPLEVAGLAGMSFAGRGFLAVPLGFIFDIAYGAPTGALEVLFFPFTILALVLVAARYFASKYFFDRSSTRRL